MARIAAFAFDADGMASFLRGLDQIHLVAIHRSKPDVRGRYFGTDVDAAVEWAQSLNRDHFGLYWTANKVPDGFNGKPKKTDMASARVVHCDIDPPRDGSGFAIAATLETLDNLRCPPSWVIGSGNGLQPVWLLDDDCQNLEAIEAINQQVRTMFNADACFNVDRLLRLPGAVNWPSPTKETRGRKPVMATLLRENTGEVYSPETLRAFFPAAEHGEKAEAERKSVSLGNIELLTASDLGLATFNRLRRALEHPKGSDRSAYGQHAAHEGVREGLSDDQIAGLLLNPENPASGHFLDQSDPMRAVRRAIGRARGEDPDVQVVPQEAREAVARLGTGKESLHVAEPEPDPSPEATGEAKPFDWHTPLKGGMREMVDTILRYAPSPRPELALGAAISLFAAAAGRRYQTESGLMTNIYIVGLSPSGSGKNLPVKAPGSVLVNARAENIVGGSEIVSGRGIMSALEGSASLYLPIDEMGKVIAAMHDPRGNLREAINVLLKMYSAADDVFKSAMYANRADRPTKLIHRPCLGLYGVATPGSFWGKLTRASIEDGLLPRFILLMDRKADEPPPRRLQRAIWSDGLIDAVKAVIRGAEGHNAFPMGEGPETSCTPYKVPYADEEADAFEYELRMRQYEMKKTVEEDMVPFVNRVAENALKLALVKCVSECPEAPVMRRADMEWGWAISHNSVNEFIAQVAGNVSENEHEARAKAVEASVVACGADGATMAAIGKKCAWISGPDRAHILDDLVERGVLEKAVTKPTKGRPTTRYWVAGLMPPADLPTDKI